MSNPYIPGGCTPTEAFPCSACPPKELGRVRGVFFLSNTYNNGNGWLDISNPTEWDNAICNGFVYIIPFTHGSFKMNPKESNSFGSVDKEVDSYEMVINMQEANILNSVPWWNTMKNTHTFYVGFITQTQIYMGDSVAEIMPQYAVDDDLQSRVLMSADLKWVTQNLPVPAPIPTGIFSNCLDLPCS